MNILAIETSTHQGSLAIGKMDGSLQVVASKSWHRSRSHGELLTPSLEELLKTADLTIKDIHLIICGHGPGSFTGIRIGLNLAKTLAYSLNIPVVTFDSLEILAFSLCSSQSDILAAINAHKSQVYAALYTCKNGRWKIKKKPKAYDSKTFSKTFKTKCFFIGDGYTNFFDSFSKKQIQIYSRVPGISHYPDATAALRLWSVQSKKTKPKSWSEISPLYIRGSEAEEKLKSGKLKPLPSL